MGQRGDTWTPNILDRLCNFGEEIIAANTRPALCRLELQKLIDVVIPKLDLLDDEREIFIDTAKTVIDMDDITFMQGMPKLGLELIKLINEHYATNGGDLDG